MEAPPRVACMDTRHPRRLLTSGQAQIPHPLIMTKPQLVEHVKDEETNDMVGYFGDDPGEPVVVAAGSIACVSSVCFHRSGANGTDQPRRVYLAQYSAEPIMTEDGSRVRHLAKPFLEGGKRIGNVV